jgi:hypothetical protein
MSKIRYPAPTERLPQTQEFCSCLPPGSITPLGKSANEVQENREEVIPIAPVLNELLQTALASYFPCSVPFSLLLLHITQFEYVPMPPNSPLLHKRMNCHAPASFLAQVIHPVRRALRASDLALVDESGSGAALLFPQVDRVGIACIAERILHSINLLQAETVVPPLRHQTEIVLGVSSYPALAASPEELLVQASQVCERVVFRPAVLPESARREARAARVRGTTRRGVAQEERMRVVQPQAVPFMQIPSRLPTRLKQLVPYALALELRCAPVGRDHNRLTVAMANPADTRAICQLREVTGMTIFPVSCELSALETLLASNW